MKSERLKNVSAVLSLALSLMTIVVLGGCGETHEHSHEGMAAHDAAASGHEMPGMSMTPTTLATTTMPAEPSTSVAGTPVAGDQNVTIDNFVFKPATLTIRVGATVTWTNSDDVPHTVTATVKPRAFDSKALDTDQKFSFTFTKPGTYDYFCAVHPHMTGKVVVVP